MYAWLWGRKTCEGRDVVVGYLVVGVLAGTLGLFVALGLGAPIWAAAFTYGLTGAAFTLSLAFVLPLIGNRSRDDTDARMSDDAGPDDAAHEKDPAFEPFLRILAVDDDPFIRELIPKIAIRAGYPEVSVCGSGNEALALLGRAPVPFDVLLLDINMPDMDGIELCGRIRRMPGYGDAPVIMLTAMSDLGHLDRAFRAGATDYTTKPFDIIEFAERLRLAGSQVMSNTGTAGTGAEAAPIHDTAGEPVPQPDSAAVSEALIDTTALANYIARLSGTALSDAFVIAIQVDPKAADPASGSIAMQDRMLERTAAAIAAVFGDAGCFLSDAGAGRFLVLSSASVLPDTEATEAAIQRAMEGTHQTAAPVDVTAGVPQRLGFGKANRASVAFRRATMLADDRLAWKRGGMPGASVRSVK
jgi:CheY-like chemotaxis protein